MSMDRRDFLTTVGATLTAVVTGAILGRCAHIPPQMPPEPVPMPEMFDLPPGENDPTVEAFVRLYDANVRQLIESMGSSFPAGVV